MPSSILSPNNGVWSRENLIEAISQVEAMTDLPITSEQLYPFLDYTRLVEHDSTPEIERFCQQAIEYPFAAICVYADNAACARVVIDEHPLLLACVANFPGGNDSMHAIEQQIDKALAANASEIDFVFPYTLYIAGQETVACDMLRVIRRYADGVTLKVIVESGAFDDLSLLGKMCRDIIACGADFIKTSTGKIEQGASLPAAAVMLAEIAREADMQCRPVDKLRTDSEQRRAEFTQKRVVLSERSESKDLLLRSVGFKASGGIRTLQDAAKYYSLASLIMGEEWMTPDHFRIGTSRVL